jgi:hypothetical protein
MSVIQDNYKAWANILKTKTGIDYSAEGREVIQQMADGYCKAKDAGDEQGKNMYIAGLMLRYWYVINNLKEKAASIPDVEYEDFIIMLYEEIEYACKYRAWQDPTKKVNAQQCINQCIARIVPALYYRSNLQKNKANINTTSLDYTINEEGKTILDTLLDEEAENRLHYEDSTNAVYDIIQYFINKKKIEEAIILDTIAFNDVQKVTKTTTKAVDEDGNEYKQVHWSSEFQRSKCIKALNSLAEDYVDYFRTQYNVIDDELLAAFNVIKNANNNKLYQHLDKTLSTAKNILQHNYIG